MLHMIHVMTGGRSSSTAAILLSVNLILALIHLPSPCLSSSAAQASAAGGSSEDRDDFAEFEEEDEDNVLRTAGRRGDQQQQVPIVQQQQQQSVPVQKADMTANEDSDEASVDEEGDGEEEAVFEEMTRAKDAGKLKITDIPAHLRGNWDSYYMEILLAAGILVYFLNFLTGRSKNERIAAAWLTSHRDILESNFALVGDDGKKEIEEKDLLKESESTFLLWCSGRVSIESMLIEIRLWRRQDLLSVLSKIMRPVKDQIILKANLADNAMDNFVFCVASKRSAIRLLKEYTDLATFTPERKNIEKYGMNKDKFFLLNEIPEVSAAIFDARIVTLFNQFEDAIDYIHISDQFSGPKPSEYETPALKMPETRRIATFAFNLTPSKGLSTLEGIAEKRPLLQMVFYLMDKLRKIRLSKEGKAKSEKNRQKVEETFLKATHFQRQEAAQQKREERRRAEKEKILNEDDPEKQRKWEEREYRKEIKRKTPKMKQMKVKAM